MMENKEQLNVFRLLRIARDIKVKDLACKLEVTPAYINSIEKGERYPSNRLLKDYAEALDVDIEVIKEFRPDGTGENVFEKTLLNLLNIICGSNQNREKQS